MIAAPRRVRILIPKGHWTAVRSSVFTDVLRETENPKTAAVYLNLYDRVWHTRDRRVTACDCDVARWAGLDPRTAADCLDLLWEKKLVLIERHGKKRSRTKKNVWSVPHAVFRLEQGHWTPAPRFLLTTYPRAYAKAVLLSVIQFHQNMSWRNDSWPGATWLSKLTGWAPRTVYAALNEMGHRRRWEQLGFDLIWPLNITCFTNKRGDEVRHFNLRAVNYFRKQTSGYSTVGIVREFSEWFNLPTKVHPVDFESWDEMDGTDSRE